MKKPNFNDVGVTKDAKQEAKHLVASERRGPIKRNAMGLPQGATMDDRIISREFYNANKFTIKFWLQLDQVDYIKVSGKDPGPPCIVCEPDSFVTLNHCYYTAEFPAGVLPDEVILHLNFGDEMFKGIKPNREAIRKARKHVGQ